MAVAIHFLLDTINIDGVRLDMKEDAEFGKLVGESMNNTPLVSFTPLHLYKYIDLDNKYHKENLAKNQIFLASASLFNDPFDSAVPIRYDQGKKYEIMGSIIKVVKKRYPHKKKKGLVLRMCACPGHENTRYLV